MNTALHLIAWTLSLLAIGSAALRLASRWAPGGLERVVAAAPLAGAAIVGEAMVLGLVSLGSDTLVLLGAALLTWLLVRWRVPAPANPLLGDSGRRFALLGTGEMVALGAAGGAFGFVAYWALRYPAVGLDPSIYHYVDVNMWIHNGQPGSIVPISYDYPFGNYPLTNEVLLTWNAALARSWVPLSLWAAVVYLLAGTGLWLTARTLGAGRLGAAAVIVVLFCMPNMAGQLTEPLTDIPMLAWLACAVALAVRSPGRPGLLVPAIVAAGLAVGTKTPALVPVVLVLGLFLWRGRKSLRPYVVPLLLATAAALLVGTYWYVRNLVTHGSPFWPFVATPWGDPVPRQIDLTVGHTFLERPGRTWRESRESIWDHALAAGVIVLVAGMLVGLLDRRRKVLAASGLALLSLLAWFGAPGSGVPDPPVFLFTEWPASTSRYVGPGVAAGALALAIVGARRDWLGRGALLVLVGSAGWNLYRTLTLGVPAMPPAHHIVAAAVAGGILLTAAAGVARRLGSHVPPFSTPARGALAVLAAVLIAFGLVSSTDDYAQRSAATEKSTALGHAPSVFGTSLLTSFFAQPAWQRGHQPIFFSARGMVAQLAGNHFEHPFRLIPAHQSCAAAGRDLTKGWVVVAPEATYANFLGVRPFPVARCFLLGPMPPRARESGFSVYRDAPD